MDELSAEIVLRHRGQIQLVYLVLERINVLVGSGHVEQLKDILEHGAVLDAGLAQAGQLVTAVEVLVGTHLCFGAAISSSLQLAHALLDKQLPSHLVLEHVELFGLATTNTHPEVTVAHQREVRGHALAVLVRLLDLRHQLTLGGIWIVDIAGDIGFGNTGIE